MTQSQRPAASDVIMAGSHSGGSRWLGGFGDRSALTTSNALTNPYVNSNPEDIVESTIWEGIDIPSFWIGTQPHLVDHNEGDLALPLRRMNPPNPSRRIALGTALAATMAAATFAPVIFSVLATSLRDEFGVARWQIGALVTVVAAVGAGLSTTTGSWADRVSPRRATALTLAVAAVGFAAMGMVPSYWMLAAAATVAGLAQAMGNPATNRLIMSQVEVGRRGLLTGLKQAGVQAGSFAGGILLPLGAASVLTWRGTVSLTAVLPLIGLGALAVATGGSGSSPGSGKSEGKKAAGPTILRLAAYAGVLGLATGALLTYLSLYAQESFSMSEAAGGSLVSAFAAVGFLTRLTAGHISERYLGHHRTLALMALVTALAGAMLAIAPASIWLWPAAVLIGLGPMAWNVVANVAVMELSPPGAAGRGSGVMMTGFLGGMAIGTPLLGASVDLWGSYRPGWWAVVVLGLVGSWIGFGVRPHD